MFLPNTTGKLSRQAGKDVYGQMTYSPTRTVPCAIVHLRTKIIKTPVRGDASATRSSSEESVSVSKILFPKTVSIAQDDKFDISGISLRAIGVQERRNVAGQIDHYEVDFGMWQG